MSIQTHGFVPRIGSMERRTIDLDIDAAQTALVSARAAQRRVDEELHSIIASGANPTAMSALEPRFEDALDRQETAATALRAGLDDLFARGAPESEIAAFRARVSAI